MVIKRKVRQAQTITPFGVGGIFDLGGESFVAADITTWGKHGVEINSRRLAVKLGVQQFRAAPVAPDGKAQYVANAAGPVYERFPKWLFCPNCRFMILWRNQDEETGRVPTCGRCAGNPKLVPMRFIQICKNGHMGDVDWRLWAHSTADTPEQRQCGMRALKFTIGTRSSGLDSLKVRCMTCHANRSLLAVTQKDILKRLGLECTGRQPWQRDEDAHACGETPRVVQRGASNVYFTLVHSAIDIPNVIGVDSSDDQADQRVYDHKVWPDLVSSPTSPIAEIQRAYIALECDVTEDFVDQLVRRYEQETSGHVIFVSEENDLSEDEWSAFIQATPQTTASDLNKALVIREVGLGLQPDDAEFLHRLQERISQTAVVDKLREVRALEGYWRYEIQGRDNFVSVHPTGRPSWLPAVESYGEGVFIRLDEQRLRTWEKEPVIQRRIADLEQDLDSALQRDRIREYTGSILRPRYVLLHTFAHLLIRQLAFDCGYSAAALRERVYARGYPESDERRPQAGVLVYTAAGDAEGTLGGLVRQGEPPNLTEAVVRLLESATWCSNDPLCGEHAGQGFANLNRAACHACVLLPETSCETGNTLLDRALVVNVGDVPGFFQPVVEAAIELSASAVGES